MINETGKHKIYIRKLAAMFPDNKIRQAASEILATYGNEKHERETERVRLAILKISGSDLDRIRRNTTLAKQDYRDTLVAAEYPNQGRNWQVPNGPAKQKLIEKDRQQYEKWLTED